MATVSTKERRSVWSKKSRANGDGGRVAVETF